MTSLTRPSAAGRRLPRRLSLLLTFSLFAPYLAAPVQALAAPRSAFRSAGRVYGPDGWKNVEAGLARGRDAEAEMRKARDAHDEIKADEWQKKAIKEFEDAASYAEDFLRHATEDGEANLYASGRKTRAGEPPVGKAFLPNMAAGYAYFKCGCLEKDEKKKSLQFLRARDFLYKNYLGNVSDRYAHTFVQRMALIGELEGLRDAREYKQNREAIHARFKELNMNLDLWPQHKNVELADMKNPLALGLLFTRHSDLQDTPDAGKMAEDLINQIDAELAARIPMPKIVMQEPQNGLVNYQITSCVPIQFSLSNGAKVIDEQALDAKTGSGTLDVSRDTVKATADPNDEYLKEYLKLAQRLHEKEKPGPFEFAFHQAEEKPALATALTNPFPTHAGGRLALTFNNVKPKDELTLTVANKTYSYSVAQEAQTAIATWDIDTAFGRSAQAKVTYKRNGAEVFSKPLTLVSDAKSEASYYLSSDYGPIALLMVRYASFEKPGETLELDDRKYPVKAALDKQDGEGRDVYWIPILTEKKTPRLLAVAKLSASPDPGLKLSGDVKTQVNGLLVAGLGADEKKPSLPRESVAALLKQADNFPASFYEAIYETQMAAVANNPAQTDELRLKDLKELDALAAAAGKGAELTKRQVALQQIIRDRETAKTKLQEPPTVAVTAVNSGVFRAIAYKTENLNKGDQVVRVIVDGITVLDSSVAPVKAADTIVYAPSGGVDKPATVMVVAEKNKKQYALTPTVLLPKTPAPIESLSPEAQKAISALKEAAKQEHPPDTMPLYQLASVGRLMQQEALAALGKPLDRAAITGEKEIADAQKRWQDAQSAATRLADISRRVEALQKDAGKDLQLGLNAIAQNREALALSIAGAVQPRSVAYNNDKKQVSVETWASPERLLLKGKPITAKVERDAANPKVLLISGLKPADAGKLSIDGLPMEIAAATPEADLTSLIPADEELEIAIGGKNPSPPIPPIKAGSPYETRCRVRKGHPTAMTAYLADANGKQVGNIALPANELNPKIELTAAMLQKIGQKGTLKVEATDGNKTVAQQVELTMLQSGGMAFIVAIQDYPNDELPYIVGDARDLCAQLIRFGYDPGHIYTVYAYDGRVTINEREGGKQERVIQGQLTQTMLEEEFNHFLAEATRAGSKHFLIYYCGHGKANQGMDKDNLALPDGSEIWEHGWADRLLDIPKKRPDIKPLDMTVIGFYQACRKQKQKANDDVFAMSEKNQRYYYLQSCRDNEVSYTDELVGKDKKNLNINHGFFGAALTRALNQKDPQKINKLTMSDLWTDIAVELKPIVALAAETWKPDPVEQHLPLPLKNSDLIVFSPK